MFHRGHRSQTRIGHRGSSQVQHTQVARQRSQTLESRISELGPGDAGISVKPRFVVSQRIEDDTQLRRPGRRLRQNLRRG